MSTSENQTANNRPMYFRGESVVGVFTAEDGRDYTITLPDMEGRNANVWRTDSAYRDSAKALAMMLRHLRVGEDGRVQADTHFNRRYYSDPEGRALGERIAHDALACVDEQNSARG
ncbi:hypothetical protein [Salininema proteolyticum]|uniref:Uncharacterized protein n=1 Tax=Salininema proteolyticum TaxID=1607685 RepID=A0ABV8TZR1_9ACTN